MEVYLKRGDIDSIYKRVAEKHGVSEKIVKKITNSFFTRCVKDIDALKKGEKYCMTKIGVFTRLDGE